MNGCAELPLATMQCHQFAGQRQRLRQGRRRPGTDEHVGGRRDISKRSNAASGRQGRRQPFKSPVVRD